MVPAALVDALEWYAAARPATPESDVCSSRDVFQARLDSLLREALRTGLPADDAALLVAVLGEIGNNSFDHNLGQWHDAPGCRLGRTDGLDPPLFWIVDRGIGILETLRRADPSLTLPQQAVDAAFLRVLSGRAPERRGNGLKFVRAVVNGHASRALFCQSGGGVAEFGGLVSEVAEVKDRLAGVSAPGVAVVIAWRSST